MIFASNPITFVSCDTLVRNMACKIWSLVLIMRLSQAVSFISLIFPGNQPN